MNQDPARLKLRRLRLNPHIRELTRSVRISHEQFIQPLFVVEGLNEREAVKGLTDVYRETLNSLIAQITADLEAGISKFILFGVPTSKAECDFDFDFTAGIIAAIKEQFGNDVWLAVDVCLCSATIHGQCGVTNAAGDQVINQDTVAELTREALEYAQAGADCVAPSDMMDGRVASIRRALDENNFGSTVLLSYAAKFNSGFYGPFRDAADSAPKGDIELQDRATYQIDPSRPADALACALRDAEEGADIMMVKPGLPYLDLLAELSRSLPDKPWAAYEVSGEYAAIELLAAEGLTDGPRMHLECWNSLVRAGASMIISYGARHARQWINDHQR